MCMCSPSNNNLMCGWIKYSYRGGDVYSDVLQGQQPMFLYYIVWDDIIS